MKSSRPYQVSATKILTRREMAAVLADLKRKAKRSPNTRLNLIVFRLAACCGLRASEIAQLQMADVRVESARPHLRIRRGASTIEWEVSFSREVQNGEKMDTVDDIKVSRSEENIFIWCFFVAVLQLVLDKAEAYKWVKYVYVDDPISSLDEQNAVAVATHLLRMLTDAADPPRTVISTHHSLFFNVLCNELRRGSKRLFLSRSRTADAYTIRDTEATPFFHHVANLVELHEAAKSGEIFTHHFNMLRAIAEKTASFHGYRNFAECIKRDEDDVGGVLHTRLLNLLSHGGYSLYEPREMLDENKRYFRKMLYEFTSRYAFNPELLPAPKDA